MTQCGLAASAPRSHDSYCVVAGRPDAGVILLCDHAGNALPPEYGTLGLPPEQLDATSPTTSAPPA